MTGFPGLSPARLAQYQEIAKAKELSKRFRLTRFLNLTEEELLENERMWAEENGYKYKREMIPSIGIGKRKDI